MDVGTKFIDNYQGYTMTGFGTVSKVWEVVEDLGHDRFKCKCLADDTVMKLTKDYTENFSRHTIEKCLEKNGTPVLSNKAA